MSSVPDAEQRVSAAEAVTDVLARYLLSSPRFRCPGMDGATVAEVVVAEYRTAAVAGWVPTAAELAARPSGTGRHRHRLLPNRVTKVGPPNGTANPPDAALAAILRYEPHLSCQLSHALKQLQQVRALRRC